MRLLRKNIPEGRRISKDGHPYYDAYTRQVDVQQSFTVEGAHQDTRPIDISAALRKWGWATLTISQWVYAGPFCAVVGAAGPPAGMTEVGATAYSDLGPLVINEKAKVKVSGSESTGSGPSQSTGRPVMISEGVLAGGVPAGRSSRGTSPAPSSQAAPEPMDSQSGDD